MKNFYSLQVCFIFGSNSNFQWSSQIYMVKFVNNYSILIGIICVPLCCFQTKQIGIKWSADSWQHTWIFNLECKYKLTPWHWNSMPRSAELFNFFYAYPYGPVTPPKICLWVFLQISQNTIQLCITPVIGVLSPYLQNVIVRCPWNVDLLLRLALSHS